MATKTKTSTAKTTPSKKKDVAEAAKKPHADKQGRTPHPLLKVDADGVPTAKFDSIPEDFDKKKHIALKSKNFANEHDWLEFKAIECDAKAAEFRRKAKESKELGSSENRAKKKKFLAMQARLAALQAELEADGLLNDDNES